MDWLQYFLSWYFYLLLVGIIFFPLTRRIFRQSLDGGYAFAKIIGIIVLSYSMFVLGAFRLVPFTREAILGVLAVVAFFSYRNAFKGDILAKLEKSSSLINWIIIEEGLFFCGLLLWTLVRGQEPSVHGLEKFMDFGFMQSIARAKFFPPLDMWYGPDAVKPNGYPINYYYFGHLSGAMLIKLTDTYAPIGYNLVLANLLGLNLAAVFSIVINMIHYAGKQMRVAIQMSSRKLIVYGLLGALLVNMAGNAHTIYLFTKGYPNETPMAPWSPSVRADVTKLLETVNGRWPDVVGGLQEYSKYWYPNATRFIPFTIHEFPSYSYVVADLHGHVFDIPFVLLTLAIIVIGVIPHISHRHFGYLFEPESASDAKNASSQKMNEKKVQQEDHDSPPRVWAHKFILAKVPLTVLFGFMTAIHYMTNASDGPIYLMLVAATLFFLHGFTVDFFFNIFVLVFTFLVFSSPFSHFFTPFVNGIGVNCGFPLVANLAKDALTYKIGPFLFEKANCQSSQMYQLWILWGFFWLHAILLVATLWYVRNAKKFTPLTATSLIVTLLFAFGTFLIVIPEFFYIKDIYPGHFRANTMFKLGYQAYIMMSLASVYSIWRLRHMEHVILRRTSRIVSFCMVALVLIYMRLAVEAYYGQMQRPTDLDGSTWIKNSYPETHEVIQYLNTKVTGQPVVLEAQGDSYTDYNVVSAYTGLPTVAGWWVHEWLWRGTSDIVGKRIPDIEQIYRSTDEAVTRQLLQKYRVDYVIVSELERKKYNVGELKIDEEKFAKMGRIVFTSSNGKATVYRMN